MRQQNVAHQKHHQGMFTVNSIYSKLAVLLISTTLLASSLAMASAAMAADAAKDAAKTGPAKKIEAAKIQKTDTAATQGASDEGTLVDVADIDESYDLPEYPMGARIAMGEMETYTIEEEDTFLDIARHFGLGYVELRAANPGIDPWAPSPGEVVLIPNHNLLPRARQEGIVVNLGEMRMYYFKDPGKEPLTYALGIGREGLATPLGNTTVIRKANGPSWHPTERMRKEKPYLPLSIPPGPANPLGTHALYLGWPTFLIHGSNKPWGIGRRVSSGCMRMYPEDIVKLFGITPVGVKVTIVDQPILVGWLDDGLYLEANPSKTQSNQIEMEGTHEIKPLTDELRKVITDAAGVAASRIDWSTAERVVNERRGYPVMIASPSPEKRAKNNVPSTAEMN